MKKKRSTNDLGINETAQFRQIEKYFMTCCNHFGYKEIKTSTIEPLHIFSGLEALSQSRLRRVYSFIDWDGWSGERVALKPDSTVSVTRFFGEHLLNQVTNCRLCYVDNHFEWADSWEELSERWQCGVENIGEKSPEIDAEVIYMAYDIIKHVMKNSVYLFLSYPRIVAQLLSIICPDEKDLLLSDIKKGSFGSVKDAFRQEKNGDAMLSLLTMKGQSFNFIGNIRNSLQDKPFQGICDKLMYFETVCHTLTKLDIPYIIDFSMIGDLEYYTDIQFQIQPVAERKSKKDILCAGGRYDNLIKAMWDLSESIPAIGFALYTRNIIKVIPPQDSLTQNVCIQVPHISHQNMTTARRLCYKLYELGFTPHIRLSPLDQKAYDTFGMVIDVDHERKKDTCHIIHSQTIGNIILNNLLGDINA